MGYIGVRCKGVNHWSSLDRRDIFINLRFCNNFLGLFKGCWSVWSRTGLDYQS